MKTLIILFQFHKVQLKGLWLSPRQRYITTFQFHKVQLKVDLTNLREIRIK